MFSHSVSNRTLVVISVALLFAVAVATALAKEGDGRRGTIHVTKECSHYRGNAGGYCTIVSSNIPSIPPGSQVFYTQAANAPNPNDPFVTEYNSIPLDSNVVLLVTTADWAVGRCTLNLLATGLCTFSDGTGRLAGFSARIDVTPAGNVFRWEGSYSFSAKPTD